MIKQIHVCDCCGNTLNSQSETYRINVQTDSFWNDNESNVDIKIYEFCKTCAYNIKETLRKMTDEKKIKGQKDDYMEGVKYAIYEIMKEADIPGSNEIRDSGGSDDDMCACVAEKIRAEMATPSENPPLTPELLKQMDGKPVYYTWDDIGWAKVVVIDGYPHIAACIDHGNGYECHLYTPIDIDGNSYTYAHKPEAKEAVQDVPY